MKVILFGSGKLNRWRQFSRIFEKAFIFFCLFGFFTGIWLYNGENNNSNGYFGNPESRMKILTSVRNSLLEKEQDNYYQMPEILYPLDNHTVSSAFTPDLFYIWKNISSLPIVFQISSRSDFSNGLIMEEKLSGNSVHGRFLPPGVYYWRLFSEELKVDSPPMRLVILSTLKAPETYSPREGENIKIEEGIPLDFRWEKLDYADSYDFKLFSIGNPVPLYEVSSLRDTVVQAYFNSDTAGRYCWTIQANREALNEMSRKKGLIKENYFNIGSSTEGPVAGFVRGVIKAGAVRAPISQIVPWNGVSLYNSNYSASQLRWSANETLINTRIIFSRDIDPASDPEAIVYYAGDETASFALPPLGEGVWYWIVQGNTKTGQGLSAAAPSWFTIIPPPPLASPIYINPLDDVVITLDELMDNRKLMFQWEEVSDANAYIFTLFDTVDQKMLITSPPRQETYFELYDLAILNANDYNWHVEAVNISKNRVIERRGIIKESSFIVNVTRSDNLRARVQGTGYGY